MYSAVKNRSIDYLRNAFVNSQFVPEENSEYIIETNNPHFSIENEELEIIVKNAIEELPIKCHAIFSMSRFGELTNKEISLTLDISEKTVENQITIAIKRIKFAVIKYFNC